VPPIIDDDIKEGNLLFEKRPEVAVCLVSHKNLYRIVPVYLTSLLDIYAIDSALWSEILFPHLETPTTVYSNF